MNLTLEVIPTTTTMPAATRRTFGERGGSIGRHPSNDLVLPDRKVSSHHAVISYRDGEFYIEDRSRNGVFLNSISNRLTRGEPQALQPDDVLFIDPYEIRVSITEDVSAAAVALGRDDDPFGEQYAPADAAALPPLALDDDEEALYNPLDAEVDPLELLGSGRAPRQPPPAADRSRIPEDCDPLGGTFAPEQHTSISRPRSISTPSDETGVAAAASRTSKVHFTAFCPTFLTAGVWHRLLVYIHTPEARLAIDRDQRKRLRSEHDAVWPTTAQATDAIQKGAAIRINPRVDGVRFNPPHADLLWLDDWQVAEFAMRNEPAVRNDGAQLLTGVIEFRVGPLLVGEVPLCAETVGQSDRAEESGATVPTESSTPMFAAIFPSYAHDDADLVERLEIAYSVLNLRYLRDVKELRAGQRWQRRIRELIEEADIFQLCWSASASQSPYVASEWRYALQLARVNFVRPIYWQTPMAPPPPELAHLHFQQLRLT